MLAAMEDLLDSWAGLADCCVPRPLPIERVTDQQYAIFDGRLQAPSRRSGRYLRLRQKRASSRPSASATQRETDVDSTSSSLSSSERRAAQKEVAFIERHLDKLGAEVQTLHRRMSDHDHSDYEGLQRLSEQLRAVEVETGDLEERWMELSDPIG